MNVKNALYLLFNYHVNKSEPPSSTMDASTSTLTYGESGDTNLQTKYDGMKIFCLISS